MPGIAPLQAPAVAPGSAGRSMYLLDLTKSRTDVALCSFDTCTIRVCPKLVDARPPLYAVCSGAIMCCDGGIVSSAAPPKASHRWDRPF